jgi:cellulose synthase/poly-beta-1,6-N-acetylglucosamine synthase-like glycosyltransferase/peptidoglycan/xylan/chitin deacetylase (PgdA/CDA1 family)/spore germination protein YaaH
MKERKPIFYDERQRRWRRMRRTMEVVGVLLSLLLLNFVASVFINPDLPELVLTETRPGVHAARPKHKAKPVTVRTGRHKRIAAMGKIPEHYDPLRAAFYVGWSPASLASLQQHYRELDLVITDSMHAFSANGRVDVDKDPRMKAWLDTVGVEIPMMPMVNNAQGKVWRTDEMVKLLANPTARRRAIDMIMSYTANTKQAGVVLDFEDVPDASQADFRELVKELGIGMHSINLKLLVALPAADPVYEYKKVAALADAIILMNYDQHWLSSAPGAISSQDWFAANLENLLKEVPPEKVIVAVGNYAYDWTEPRGGEQRMQAATRSIQEAMVTAKESEGKIEFDDDLLNPHFSYYDEDNRLHQVWMLDGVTGYNQLRAAERANVHGTALWRLGAEDPSLWSIWDVTKPDDAARARLATMPPGNDLILEGEGDVWKILSNPKFGKREFHYDPISELITDENIVAFPLSYEIDQIGAAKKKIALSFDDGPDPKFTPQILDILKQKKVPGLFFLIGEAASDHPALMKRIYDEGHEIGNHTFRHPHFSTISSGQLGIELNLTERLLESKLGIKSLLFRPPYGIDHTPETAEEIAMLPETQRLGYVLVGSRIDPHDWARPPADEIVEEVLKDAKAGSGNIVLLHDGGGDRSQTVLALPRIIEGLRSAGFEFVSVSNLLGKSRAEVMPALTATEQLRAQADAFIFNLLHGFRLTMVWVFLVGIALVSARVLIVGMLALIEKFLPQDIARPDFCPRVSVLIPAHNEEIAIVGTVQSALNSRLPGDWPRIEVIVVNDGSTDSTGEQLFQHFAHDARVHIIEQPNMGKPAALNRASAVAGGEVLITIDADTYVEPDAIEKLARHFGDATVGAVAGNVKVGNRDRWLTRWQALEYVTSQNMEKRAFDLLNCIAVVPGALGAWRTEAVQAAGGISADTVAEDTDLTIAIRRRGWRILYDDKAIAHTQAPETARELVRQRLRWTFGTMQAVWKHRDTLGRWRYGTLGWIALPNVFLFQILLPLFSPVIDLLFLVTLLLWGLAQIPALSGHVQQLWTTDDVVRSLIFFAAFMLIDLLTCVVAFALEKKEDWTLLAPLLPQRFYYRQMMYWVLFRAVMQAAQGRAVGWKGPEPKHQAPQVPTAVGHA